MAHISKLEDKPRALPWLAAINRKGFKSRKMFASKDEAEHWAGEVEREIRMHGTPKTNDNLKKHTVKDIVSRYLKEVTPTKGCKVSEELVLKKFLRHPIASKSLAYVTREDAIQYRNERLKDTWTPKGSRKSKPIKPSTVYREIGSIKHVFEVAKDEWGLTNLVNPFRALKIKGSNKVDRRKRRLLPGEGERLRQACKRCLGLNRYYVPLAISLAVQTGMRLQEIFNLIWQDIDLEKREIKIRKSKTDHVNKYDGRVIVMSIMASIFFAHLGLRLMAEGAYKATNRIFPMTKDAFKQSWADVKGRAEIEDLTFHDLRHEAGSRFEEAGLTRAENEHMLGHKSRDINSGYIHAALESIRDKLDRHFLKGQTLEEVEKDCAKEAKDLGLTVQEYLAKHIQELIKELGLDRIKPLPVC